MGCDECFLDVTGSTALFGDGETIEDYALHLEGMAVHINTLGKELKD